jgi:hypothetical protein
VKKRNMSSGLFRSNFLKPFTLRLGFGLGCVDLCGCSVGISDVGDGRRPQRTLLGVDTF